MNQMLDMSRIGEDFSLFSTSAMLHNSVAKEASTNKMQARQAKLSAPNEPQDTINLQLPNVAIDMKIATAQYAMYLSFDERDRMFRELDYLLNANGWDPDDSVPTVEPYINFLKWLVETKHLEWSSLGFDADGNLLCAFVAANGTVTAAFLSKPIVLWSSVFRDEDGDEFATGQSPLRSFVHTSLALLARLHGDN